MAIFPFAADKDESVAVNTGVHVSAASFTISAGYQVITVLSKMAHSGCTAGTAQICFCSLVPLSTVK